MSVSIRCENLCKKYGDNTIIQDLSVDINDTEFFTLLGPSGCGKTTLLRMIIGFNSIEGGTIYFDNKAVNDIPANKRNIGMVFQNYALFPNMNVYDNVAFGLKNRKVSKAEIKERVTDILKTVKIEDLKNRKPDEMSGGQQQRVALARAIVIHPDVLLMDEPLSNLDAKLRVEMRNAIKEIQNEIGITTVYVTHDQEEAMAVSDRIAVMNGGVIQQVGTPKDIYRRPANIFVAKFIGRTNILKGNIFKKDGEEGVVFTDGTKVCMTDLKESCTDGQPVQISIRPEEFRIVEKSDNTLRAVVHDTIFLGNCTESFVDLSLGDRIQIQVNSQSDTNLSKGEEISLYPNTGAINVFTEDGAENLVKGVRNDLNKE